MKTIISLLILTFTILSCQTTKVTSLKDSTPPQINETENDSVQYELIVFDTKYDSYLAMQPSMNFYSQEYYEIWNQQYVTEWNIRHNNALRHGDFYETYIDYNSHTDYGLELNYKLYYYFLFIEKEYGITLIKRGKTAR